MPLIPFFGRASTRQSVQQNVKPPKFLLDGFRHVWVRAQVSAFDETARTLLAEHLARGLQIAETRDDDAGARVAKVAGCFKSNPGGPTCDQSSFSVDPQKLGPGISWQLLELRNQHLAIAEDSADLQFATERLDVPGQRADVDISPVLDL